MKRKLLLFLTFGLYFCSEVKSQDSNTLSKTNTYRIEIQGVNQENLPKVTNLLTQFTTATSISYSALDNIFTLTSTRELDKNVICGKMQKNYFPVAVFKKAGEVDSSFPKMKNTGNPETDANNYDQEKAKWIKENPEEYQKMLDNPSPKTTPNN